MDFAAVIAGSNIKTQNYIPMRLQFPPIAISVEKKSF